jgi:hypothetical protein
MKKQSGLLRRLTALALALCMLAALTAEIFAADTVASGYCGSEGDGKNLTWTLDSEGVLTISGLGKMKIACRICLYRPATFLPCHHQAG